MRKIFFVLFLSLFCAAPAGASELLGSISTNQNYSPSSETGQGSGQTNTASVSSVKSSAKKSANSSSIAKKVLPERMIIDKNISSGASKKNTAQVLGVKIYPDGALLRGRGGKIYLVRGKFKKYLANLQELKKYRGQKINSVSEEELALYETRSHLEGELIRQKNDAKIYEIAKGGKHHILNLNELRVNYFKQEIFNITEKEMALY